MTGVQFVVDDKGETKSVLIDLSVHGELWEDFYDSIIAEERRNEPTISFEELKKEIAAKWNDEWISEEHR